MAHYRTSDKNHVLEYDEVERMIARAENPRDKAALALSFIWPLRPIELLRLKRGDFDLSPLQEGFDYFRFTFKAAKKASVRGFHFDDRTLETYLDFPFVKHLLAYVEAIGNPNAPLFPISSRRWHEIVKHVSDGKITPYNFRHSRSWYMGQAAGQNKMADSDIMYARGDTDPNSIAPYVSTKPPVNKLKIFSSIDEVRRQKQQGGSEQ